MDRSRFELAHEKLRADLVSRNVSPGYNPTLHLLCPSAIGFGVAILALALLRDLRPVELWTVPIALVLSLGLEWRAHKDILHRRWPLPGFSMLYDRHERLHHVIFPAEDMQMRSRDERALVLMPGFAIVLVTVLLVPLALGVGYLTSRNRGLLVLGTGALFFVSYELMHLSYHLPADHPVARWRIIRRLSALHRTHHHPPNMKRWNFNVTVPLFDVVHGTLKREDVAQFDSVRKAERASRGLSSSATTAAGRDSR
jgi:sterol desaturase/sphingolipid hydroxylase (fatty acid hydroxylase superfamily)